MYWIICILSSLRTLTLLITGCFVLTHQALFLRWQPTAHTVSRYSQATQHSSWYFLIRFTLSPARGFPHSPRPFIYVLHLVHSNQRNTASSLRSPLPSIPVSPRVSPALNHCVSWVSSLAFHPPSLSPYSGVRLVFPLISLPLVRTK